MKVCTDATLFGAMAPVTGGEKVLDIGTGTGLLALMAAQLGAANITAVELTEDACREAGVNFDNSPWAGRLQAVHRDIRQYAGECGERYDLIISNPPFFDGHSRSATPMRSAARHNDQLPYADLLQAVVQLLVERGQLYLLLPTHAVERFTELAAKSGLHMWRRMDIRGYEHNNPKVSALTFGRSAIPPKVLLMTIYKSPNVYSEESERYLSGFLLRFATTHRPISG